MNHGFTLTGVESIGFGADIAGIFILVYYVVMAAISLGSYILISYSLYTIAKNRGIRHPFLAWLPLGSNWILGSVSDQYQYVAKGRVKNKRKLMLILEIILYVLLVLYFVSLGAVVFQMLGSRHAIDHGAITSLMWMIVTALAMLGVSIALAVLRYVSLYDLYASCEPQNKVIYLLLTIFVGITEPILLFICRNKEEGMPPRKAEPKAIPPEPWEQSCEE